MEEDEVGAAAAAEALAPEGPAGRRETIDVLLLRLFTLFLLDTSVIAAAAADEAAAGVAFACSSSSSEDSMTWNSVSKVGGST